jgi:hypothetical protein
MASLQELMASVAPDNKQAVLQALQKRFSNPAVVAGIMGNIDHETGGTFDYAQRQKGGPARGLIQMEGVMLNGYQKYLANNGKQDSVDSQLDFLNDAMTSGSTYDIGAGHRAKLQKAMLLNDPLRFSEEFVNRVERPGIPHMDRRQERTQYWADQIGGSKDVNNNKEYEKEVTFGDLFKTARKSGKKEFEYKGKKYTTEVKQ